jgi:hypothetical protein
MIFSDYENFKELKSPRNDVQAIYDKLNNFKSILNSINKDKLRNEFDYLEANIRTDLKDIMDKYAYNEQLYSEAIDLFNEIMQEKIQNENINDNKIADLEDELTDMEIAKNEAEDLVDIHEHRFYSKIDDLYILNNVLTEIDTIKKTSGKCQKDRKRV